MSDENARDRRLGAHRWEFIKNVPLLESDTGDNVVNSVDLSINLQAVLRQDEDIWVAWCPSLDIASQAETQDEAHQSLEAAVEGWFESCLERGVLKEALKEAGFVLSKDGMPVSGVLAVREENSVERPIQFRLPAYMAAELLAPNHAAH